MNRIAFVAYGKDEIRQQALHSAMSALAHAEGLPLAIHVYTDVPEAFGTIADRVEFHPARAEDVAAWIGPERFSLRAKPFVFRDLARRQAGDPILLADADTFFTGDVARAFGRIGPGSAVMWEREYHVATSDTALMHRFRRRLRRARFRGAPIDLGVDMWNSGAVGLHPDQFALADEWLAFVDEVYPPTRRWIMEQFAISWVLQRAGVAVHACDDVLVHYWFDKPGHGAAVRAAAVRAAMDHVRGRPLDEALADIRANPISLPRTRSYGKKANFFQRAFGW